MNIVGPVNQWFTEHARALPWREEGFPAWGVLVSEIMLQQTPVARVIPRLEAWLDRWPTPAHLAADAPGDAVRAWDRLGYPRRALALHAAAVAITERHDGIVPHDVDQLLALPGVGDYTARAVASFAYGIRHPVVDTNVRRVIARAVIGQGEAGPARTRVDLASMEALLPTDPGQAQLTNAAIMELGAVVCTARAPRCGDCPIAERCAWRLAGCPPYDGARPMRQKKFEGSDRQVRGRMLALLRQDTRSRQRTELLALCSDPAQAERALSGLVADGLVADAAEGYRLP